MRTFRVINETDVEICAELGDLDLAMKMANRFAEDEQHRKIFCVVELVTRYETGTTKTK
jgi:hypothetical protein